MDQVSIERKDVDHRADPQRKGHCGFRRTFFIRQRSVKKATARGSGRWQKDKCCDRLTSEGGRHATPLALLGLSDQKVPKTDRLAIVDHVGEQLTHDVVEVVLLDRIEVVLAIAARLNHLRHSQQSEVMADSGLALAQTLAQGRNVQFAFPHQIHQDLQAGLVSQKLEDLDQVFFQLLGEIGRSCDRSGLDLWCIQQFGGHLFVFQGWGCGAGEVIPTFGSVWALRVLRLEIGQRLDLR